MDVAISDKRVFSKKSAKKQQKEMPLRKLETPA
jgi:hypothetical protein